MEVLFIPAIHAKKRNLVIKVSFCIVMYNWIAKDTFFSKKIKENLVV